ncbi:MAG: hypothetical protein ACLRWP_02710 [Bilophila wadsworthia]
MRKSCRTSRPPITCENSHRRAWSTSSKRSNTSGSRLDLIATYSFALYFLHDFILFTFQNLLFTFFGILLPESLFFVSLFTFFCEVVLCLLLIMGIKKLLGRRSRYVIGS